MRELRTPGFVRGALSNERPYRDNDPGPHLSCPSRASGPTLSACVLHIITINSRGGIKVRSDAHASEVPPAIHAHAGVFAAVGLLAKISPVYFSRAR